MVSDKVGCGWMVRPMSRASAPISMASADEVAGVWPDYAAANNAFVRWFSSNSILVTPSSWPSESERPDAVL
jgi:hypothetical protein